RGLAEGLILDVADYRHVPHGPGVLLVGHDVDYGVGADAFTVVRKRSSTDPTAAQLRDALRMGLGTLDAIAADGELAVTVDRAHLTVTVPDRRLGPPDQVVPALRAEIEPTIAELYGPDATIRRANTDDPRSAPGLWVEAAADAAAGVLAKLGGSQAPGQSPWDISVEELARLRDSGSDFTLLDVREASEYETVNLGGTLLPLAGLSDRLDQMDRDAHIVVHCRAGGRGAEAVGQLRDAGFTEAWNVNGGLMAWIDRVDPSLPRY
ncbi:MAG TPA: rhodanese-like domain-containing protein, partial [Euzebya sp.]|nr:rhodanese-like domain-containing protein [Euzebya sp.]